MKTVTRIIHIGFPGGFWGKGQEGKLIQAIDPGLPTSQYLTYPPLAGWTIPTWVKRGLLLLQAHIWLVLDMQSAWWVPLLRGLLGKKVVLYVDRPLAGLRPGWLARWRTWKEVRILRAASQVIAAHEAISEALKRRYDIQSAVACWREQPSEAAMPAPAQAKPKSAYALGMAEVVRDQQLEVVLQAFAQYPRYRLVLAGNWEKSLYGRRLKAHYQAYPNIQLLSPPQDLTAWQQLKQNPLFFLQTPPQNRQQLRALIDAMQLGLPVVSIDTPFNRELTYHQAIYFQHPGEFISQLEAHNRLRLDMIGKNLAKQVQTRQPQQGLGELCRFTFSQLQPQAHTTLVPGLEDLASWLVNSINQPDQRRKPAQQG